MREKTVSETLRTISERFVTGGGFSEHPGSPARPDATAWAILALKVSGARSDILDRSRSWLAFEQHPDGRVCLSKVHPEVIWPTALAILAWNGSGAHCDSLDRAIRFLIKARGSSSAERDTSISPIDFSLVGWPWVEKTFSWVEPTALSILALTNSGHGAHERVQEATRLLIDRQLPSGGWNVGSTVVYGQESYPQLENTGMALSALAGKVEKKQIERSLHYLHSKAGPCRTPHSLGWALFGLGAWEHRTPEAKRGVVECLSRQKRYGTYGTTLLSLMFLAYEAKGGFLEAIS